MKIAIVGSGNAGSIKELLQESITTPHVVLNCHSLTSPTYGIWPRTSFKIWHEGAV